jgi:hypothetical protein
LVHKLSPGFRRPKDLALYKPITHPLFLVGTKRDEVTGEWRKLHNEELSYFVLIPKYY